jgi:argininosuccinate synthase
MLGPVELLAELNSIAGRHGVGRADIVEDRLVGMKSRGVYETPAGTALYEALEDLARLVLPHDLHRTRATLALTYADLIYNGLWFSPLRRSIAAFMDEAMAMATGTVTLEFLQGTVRAIARTSPNSLYDTALASFDMTGYRPKDAEGFIRLFGLPMAAASRQRADATVAGTPAPTGHATNTSGDIPKTGTPVAAEGLVDVAG